MTHRKRSTVICKELAEELQSLLEELPELEQYWIGLAGAPGSGKSTLATALQERLGDALTVIPMDGYHYPRSELDKMSNPAEAHAHRGAPFTFNAEKCVQDLTIARTLHEGSFPAFDHKQGDPVENGIVLKKGKRIVLVEGIYLLLNDPPWCELRRKIFDQTWFLSVPVGKCMKRVEDRHVLTGLSRREAKKRVRDNDRPNAELLVPVSERNADRLLI